MSEEHKRLLEQQLWNIANTLRGKMNADEFRDYILGFIFYKYLSEKMHLYANTLLDEDGGGLDYTELNEASAEDREIIAAIAEEAVPKLGFMLKPAELFSAIAQRGQDNSFILDDLTRILSNIERSTMGTESEDDFNQLFEDLDLTSSKLGKTEKQKNELVVKVLNHLDKIDFRLEDSHADVLGDAYEYLIGQFASGAGKKAGEFYTPQTVSSILARLVTADKQVLKSVYDPTCGSGSLLLRVAKEVRDVGHFYGQELNRTTYNLARMNMILHNVNYRKFDIVQEDSLEHPQHINERFEAIVANPPFSAHWSANPLFQSDDRFSQYGKLAPQTKADFAFVLHMIHHLADNGNMAVVLPHGVLFRGAAEGHIRQHLIAERNLLDAVIGLPANIFYGTSIPTCILVFKKCRTHPHDILFIDASQGFEKAKNQNNLRPEDLDKIISTYKARVAEAKYSAVVPLADIAENDYNLNIPRYVDTFEEDAAVDLAAVTAELKIIESYTIKTDEIINKFCEILRLPKPVGHNAYLLRQYKKGLMQQLFSQQIRFKDDDGRDYPDWKREAIGKYLEEYSEKVSSDTDLPILTSSRTGLFLQKDYYANREIQNDGEYGVVPKGYFTYRHMSDDLTFKFNLNTEYERGAVSKEYPVFKAVGMNSYFLQEKLNEGDEFKEFAISEKQGGTRTRLYFKRLKSLVLALPCLEEQEKIAGFLAAIDAKIQQVSAQVAQAETFKKGLLQQMFV